MRKRFSNTMFLAVVVVIGFAWALAGLSAYSAWAGIPAVLALTRLLRRIGGERNWTAIQGALSEYEEIIGGRRWVGKDAEVLASDRLDDPTEEGPVRFEHICRTTNGAWFLFDVAATHGRIVGCNLRPCDEATAQSRLRRHQEAYVRCFGQPTIA
jgi:hypothetical protein